MYNSDYNVLTFKANYNVYCVLSLGTKENNYLIMRHKHAVKTYIIKNKLNLIQYKQSNKSHPLYALFKGILKVNNYEV